MKKILRTVFLCSLAVLIAGGVALYVFFTSGEKEIPNLIVTDAAGSTYRVHIDEDKNTTYALVTDENGKVWGADFDGKTVGSTRQPLDDIYNAVDLPDVTYTGVQMDHTANAEDYMGAIPQQPTSQPTNQGGENKEDTPATPDTPTLQAYRIQKYQELFAGGRFLMVTTMVDSNGVADTPATMAVKNGNFYVSTESDGMSMQLIYLASNDTAYMLIDFMKKYCEVPEDMMEGLEFSTLLDNFQITDIGEITVSEVDFNGKTLICESYVASDGDTLNYYFDENDMLVRRDIISPSGKTNTTLWSQITTEVPDSYFEIPKNYSYLNISWLMNMAS